MTVKASESGLLTARRISRQAIAKIGVHLAAEASAPTGPARRRHACRRRVAALARRSVGGHATASSGCAEELDVGLLEAGFVDPQDRQRRVDPGDEVLGGGVLRRRRAASPVGRIGRARGPGRRSSAASAGRSTASSTTDRSSSWPFSSSGVADDRDPAVVDDAHPIGLLGLLEVVRGEEDRSCRRSLRTSAQVVPQAAAADRVEAARSARRGTARAGRCMRLRMISSLRFMPPEKVLSGLPRSSPRPTTAGQLLDALAVLGRHRAVERPVAVQAVDRDVEPDVLLAREVQVDARVLEDDPDVAPDGGRLAVEVVAGDGDRAAGLGQGRGQDADRGGLAGPVRPEEGEQLARRGPRS